MEQPTIVTLGDIQNVSSPNIVSFEEAFGEFSELRGKGRARRQKRKLERIENRRAVQKARQEARSENLSRKQDRRANRLTGLITRAGKNRQEIAKNRQEIKDMKAEHEAYRDSLGNQDSSQDPNAGYDTNGQYQDPNASYDTGGQSQDPNAGYDTGTQDYGSGSIGNNAPTTDYIPQYGNTQDNGNYSESEDESANDSFPYGYDVDNGDGGDTSGDDSMNPYDGFDGVIGSEDRYNDLGDGQYQDIQINPDIQVIADKIEWNKEFADRIKQSGKPADEIQSLLDDRKARVYQLVSVIDNYANFDDDDYDFSENDEELSMANGEKKYSPKMLSSLEKWEKNQGLSSEGMSVSERKNRKHKWQVKIASKRAKDKRNALKKKSKNQDLQSVEMNDGTNSNVTEVMSDLKPQFSTNRIEIPAENKSNFDSMETTGVNAIDNFDDIDAPDVREFYLGFDGAKVKKNIPAILIGIGLGIGVIFAIKYFKKNK